MGTIKHARGTNGDSAQIACVSVLEHDVSGQRWVAWVRATRTWLVIGIEELLCRLCGAATPYLWRRLSAAWAQKSRSGVGCWRRTRGKWMGSGPASARAETRAGRQRMTGIMVVKRKGVETV